MWLGSRKEKKGGKEEIEVLSRVEKLRNVLFVPVGSSGSVIFWMINSILRTKGKLKVLAFVSENDGKFLVEKAGVDQNDIITIGGGAGGDIKLAEMHYSNKSSEILNVIGNKQPFNYVMIFTFTGGGTGWCSYLFARDVLKKEEPRGLPKVLVVAKLPVHDQTPGMIRNTIELLKNLKELYEQYPERLSIVVFSDGVNLSQTEPRLREMLIREKKINFPDTTNIPTGDWCATILKTFSRSETDIPNLFGFATQQPLGGTYGAFSAPIIIRVSAEGDREKTMVEIINKINQLSSVIDATTLQHVKFTAREHSAIFGCLYAPPVKDPDEQQRELLTITETLNTSLAKNLGVKDPDAHLQPYYSEVATTMEILGFLRGIEFSFYKGGIVNSEKL